MTPTDELSTGEVDVFVGPNFVLSMRSRSQQRLLGVRARAEREPQLLRHGPAFVLYALMDAVVDRYLPIIDVLEVELESIESQIFERGTGRANIERLYALKNRIGTVKHAVAPLLDSAAKLFSGRVPAVCVDNREYFRDVFDHLARMNAALDSLRETLGTAIQVNLSMVTIEESEHQASRRLGRSVRRRDGLRRHLGHELRRHARAEVALGLPGGAGRHRRCLLVRVVALPARAVDLKERRP